MNVPVREEVIFLEFEGPLLGSLDSEILSGRTSRRTFLVVFEKTRPFWSGSPHGVGPGKGVVSEGL